MRSPRSAAAVICWKAARSTYVDGLDAGALRGAGELVDVLLAAVDELLHHAHVAVALGGDALAGGDDRAEPPLLVDALRVRAHVGHGGRGVGELGEVGRPADLREPLAVAQVGGDRHDVDGRARQRQRLRRLVDAAVGVAVEVLRLEDLEHPVERLAAEEDGREHRRLGVQIVRGDATVDDGRLEPLGGPSSAPSACGLHHGGHRLATGSPGFFHRLVAEMTDAPRDEPSRRLVDDRMRTRLFVEARPALPEGRTKKIRRRRASSVSGSR